MNFSRRAFLAGMGLVGVSALAGCGKPAPSRVSALPHQMVWTTYKAGTGTYNDVAALANLITTETGTRVRLMTGDSGIARIAPLMSGIASYARTGDEYYYAFEGNDEFCSEQWGPQPIRAIWSPPGGYGVLARKDSNITKPADLKGKRYPRLLASTSMNRKLEAILNLGGLTWDDVIPVETTYSAQAEALASGHLDAMYQNIQGSNIQELNVRHPIQWIDLSGNPEDYEGWDYLAPMVRVNGLPNAVGAQPNELVNVMEYSIPLTTLAEQPAGEIESVLNTIIDNFENYRDATPDMKAFAVDEILLEPMVVPFHEAAVKVLHERGRWKDVHQRQQDALLARESKMQEAWPTFWQKHGAYRPKESAAITKDWVTWKKENLPELPGFDH